MATTAIGFRGWIEAADGWGLGEALLGRLGGVELLARGPKVRGAIRAAGLTEAWSPASESMAEVLERLLDEGVEGRCVAVQLHGEPLPGFIESLRAAGRAGRGRARLPLDAAGGHRAGRPAAGRGVRAALDAVTFTSAPAAASLLDRAEQRGRLRRSCSPPSAATCCAACVGPVTALPLQAHDVPTPCSPNASGSARSCSSSPGTARAGYGRCRSPGTGWRSAATPWWSTGRCGRCRPPGCRCCGPSPAAPAGWSARADLLRALPGAGRDEHAVETAMARLRTALGAPKLIQTVVKRGYRLSLDPHADTKYAE